MNYSMSKLLLLIAMAMFATSCSSFRWGYDYADTLLLYQVDQYFDLTSEQDADVEIKIQQFMAWHRSTQLPLYVEAFKELQIRTQDGLSEEDLEWFRQQYEILLTNLLQHPQKNTEIFLASLNEQQIAHLEEKQQEEIEEEQEKLELTAEEYLEERLEDFFENFEEWLGEPTEKQEQILTEMIRAMPDSLENRIQQKIQNQQRFVKLLRSTSDPQAIHEYFLTWSKERELLWKTKFWPRWKTYLTAIDQMLTKEQREIFDERLQKWIDDFEYLMSNSA